MGSIVLIDRLMDWIHGGVLLTLLPYIYDSRSHLLIQYARVQMKLLNLNWLVSFGRNKACGTMMTTRYFILSSLSLSALSRLCFVFPVELIRSVRSCCCLCLFGCVYECLFFWAGVHAFVCVCATKIWRMNETKREKLDAWLTCCASLMWWVCGRVKERWSDVIFPQMWRRKDRRDIVRCEEHLKRRCFPCKSKQASAAAPVHTWVTYGCSGWTLLQRV